MSEVLMKVEAKVQIVSSQYHNDPKSKSCLVNIVMIQSYQTDRAGQQCKPRSGSTPLAIPSASFSKIIFRSISMITAAVFRVSAFSKFLWYKLTDPQNTPLASASLYDNLRT